METNQKLDPEFKAKWIQALRSGEYKQNTNASMLGNDEHFNTTYCCLAVACKVAGMPESKIRDAYDRMPDPAINGGYRNPVAVKLIDLNDGGVSFNSIANYIEANL
jgi:hypothetical protein